MKNAYQTMKKNLLLFLAFAINYANAQENPPKIAVKAVIDEVTVYLKGAHITRVAKNIALPQGKSVLVFDCEKSSLSENSMVQTSNSNVVI